MHAGLAVAAAGCVSRCSMSSATLGMLLSDRGGLPVHEGA